MLPDKTELTKKLNQEKTLYKKELGILETEKNEINVLLNSVKDEKLKLEEQIIELNADSEKLNKIKEINNKLEKE